MSLLWPESVLVGLFPGHCWLRRTRSELRCASGPDDQSEPSALLKALDGLLLQHADGIRKNARLHLTVSDSLAATVMLPWQEQLTTRDELLGYALANFERHGLDIGEGWTVQTAFRHHQAAGMAFAIATSWLRDARALAESKGLRLSSVLPLSMAAYHRHGHPAGVAKNIVLLRETQRLTAMVHEHGRLQGIDIEPVLGAGEEAAGRRLMRRLGAVHGGIEAVDDWAGVVPAAPTAFIGECLPAAARRSLMPDVWS